MTTIPVSQLFGSVCVDSDDGAMLCGLLRDALSTDDSVKLDFAGVGTLTSSFLNAAIGCLYSSFSADDLERRLLWKGLDDTDEGILRLVMQNAALFFAADQEERDVMAACSASALPNSDCPIMPNPDYVKSHVINLRSADLSKLPRQIVADTNVLYWVFYPGFPCAARSSGAILRNPINSTLIRISGRKQ